jgi:subtilase family serine protease
MTSRALRHIVSSIPFVVSLGGELKGLSSQWLAMHGLDCSQWVWSASTRVVACVSAGMVHAQQVPLCVNAEIAS